jgi:RsiW-degrading membrane proteinase PrsW (M82 family)
MDNRGIRIGEFVRDVRSGRDRGALQKKYRITKTSLEKILDKLIEHGFLTASDADGCHASVSVTAAAWKCPACDRPQTIVYRICPVCGVNVGKFVPKPRPVLLEVQEEPTIRNLKDVLSSARHNLNCLGKDTALSVACLTAVIPLALLMPPEDSQVILFCGIAAMIWAVFFKNIVVTHSGGWTAAIASMGFTGFTGSCFLLAIYYMLPPGYMRMAHSADLMVSLSGFVLQVGVCEELCKIAPALFYVFWKKGRSEPVPPRNVVIIAVFSAIGFSAVENVDYALRVVLYASDCVKNGGREIAVVGVKRAMVNYLFRSLVCMFLHAVLSGIFGCFLAISLHIRRFWFLWFIMGLALSAALHGLYDWLVGRSFLAAATTVWLSFVLFYSLCARPRTVSNEVAPENDEKVESTRSAFT